MEIRKHDANLEQKMEIRKHDMNLEKKDGDQKT